MTSTTEQMHEAYLKWVDTLPVDNDNRSYVVRSCMAPDKSFGAGYQAAHSELLPVMREQVTFCKMIQNLHLPKAVIDTEYENVLLRWIIEIKREADAALAKLNEILGGE